MNSPSARDSKARKNSISPPSSVAPHTRKRAQTATSEPPPNGSIHCRAKTHMNSPSWPDMKARLRNGSMISRARTAPQSNPTPSANRPSSPHMARSAPDSFLPVPHGTRKTDTATSPTTSKNRRLSTTGSPLWSSAITEETESTDRTSPSSNPWSSNANTTTTGPRKITSGSLSTSPQNIRRRMSRASASTPKTANTVSLTTPQWASKKSTGRAAVSKFISASSVRRLKRVKFISPRAAFLRIISATHPRTARCMCAATGHGLQSPERSIPIPRIRNPKKAQCSMGMSWQAIQSTKSPV